MPSSPRSLSMVGLLLGLVACGGRSSPARPDVLLVTWCTVRADHLQVYGYDREITPTLASLATEGVVFEQTLTPGPWTRPGVAATVTGMYPRTLGVEERPNQAVYEAVTTLAERFSAAGYATVGITANPNTNGRLGFAQGYDVYEGTDKLWATGYASERLRADDVNVAFLDALNDVPRDTPFFAHLLFVDAHGPRQDPVFERATRALPEVLDPYDRKIAVLDDRLRVLLGAMEGRGRAPDVLMVTADHGEGLGTWRKDDRGHGPHLYESVLWVPWMVVAPGLGVSPQRVAERVELVDVAPTLVDLVGLPHEEGDFEGLSHADALLGRGEVQARPFSVTETHYRRTDKSALLAGAHKLVVDWAAEGEPRVELYDRQADPGERTPIQDDHADQVAKWLASLTAWREAHPTRFGPSGEIETEASPGEIEALRVLGYLD